MWTRNKDLHFIHSGICPQPNAWIDVNEILHTGSCVQSLSRFRQWMKPLKTFQNGGRYLKEYLPIKKL